ncbi:hypothetical protein NVP1101O_129 [Vibrio phage 1.101.O._10N.261.45.C6]|nr:hypothetical protein NVP1101O_129 [Vibrio phage 1.101.O._10N.261.45.C6]
MNTSKLNEYFDEYVEAECLNIESEAHCEGIHYHCTWQEVSSTHHQVEGECMMCDYHRLQQQEEDDNVYWLDRCEFWDFVDYWERRNK